VSDNECLFFFFLLSTSSYDYFSLSNSWLYCHSSCPSPLHCHAQGTEPRKCESKFLFVFSAFLAFRERSFPLSNKMEFTMQKIFASASPLDTTIKRSAISRFNDITLRRERDAHSRIKATTISFGNKSLSHFGC
jgi:hypothetical protein